MRRVSILIGAFAFAAFAAIAPRPAILSQNAFAQTSSIAETRARDIISALSTGDPQDFERAAQANYTAAALARRTPAQRAQALQQIQTALGALQIVSLTKADTSVVAGIRGANGGEATFSFTIAGADQRIDSVSIQMRGAQPTASAQRADNPYAAYAFLIGEWDTPGPSGSLEGAIHQSLRWGPSNSYIWYAVYNRPRASAHEELHQEGIMTFNGRDNRLDFLFVHEPGSFNQEQGTVHADADGSIVRETTAIAGDGTVTHFRQTWRRTGANTAVTSLMRQNADGSWAPNFPGADNLAMTRRQG